MNPIQTSRTASERFARNSRDWVGPKDDISGSIVRLVAADAGRIRTHSDDFVPQKPGMILANGTPILEALQKRSRTIPIVFANVSDPIGSGFIANLARPGGNVTGFMNFE